jgi:hypothetical protein
MSVSAVRCGGVPQTPNMFAVVDLCRSFSFFTVIASAQRPYSLPRKPLNFVSPRSSAVGPRALPSPPKQIQQQLEEEGKSRQVLEQTEQARRAKRENSLRQKIEEESWRRAEPAQAQRQQLQWAQDERERRKTERLLEQAKEATCYNRGNSETRRSLLFRERQNIP